VTEKTVLYQGAEAHIIKSTFHDKAVVEKKRISKKYRIKEIDQMLISHRTREEAKLIIESRKTGISVPLIYDINLFDGIITMEYIPGEKIKKILSSLDEKERINLCKKIGKNIAKMHLNDIIHGDLTTSNMIFYDDKIFFIDFGLGCKSVEAEDKGVDLHVLMEAFESTHSEFPDCFQNVLKGYKSLMKERSKEVIDKIDDIIRRGRYR
jgi:Kae1-associated kinase Bud32